MPTATMTSKGQITVPAEVRERLGLHAGARVDFVETETGTYELRAKNGSVRDLQGMFPWHGRPITIEEMNEGVAAGAAETMRNLDD